MEWFVDTPPRDGKPFLAKIEIYNDDECRYYVLRWEEWQHRYVEAGGEQYWHIDEEEILAWTSFEELDKTIILPLA